MTQTVLITFYSLQEVCQKEMGARGGADLEREQKKMMRKIQLLRENRSFKVFDKQNEGVFEGLMAE